MTAMGTRFTLTRGQSDAGARSGKDYSSIQYSFTFRVPVDVLIESVTFFGPHKSEAGPFNYNVALKIGESYAQGRSGRMHSFMREKWWKVTAVIGSTFTITFDKAVKIPANFWTEILFQLDGPKTEYLHKDFMFPTMHDLRGIIVDTGVRGSGQLQEMQFRLA